ncbi:MAG: protein kinase [Candidatus Brocadiae bacterium]|nr:protein kinase [Candidatus Brocadiia bacterium]
MMYWHLRLRILRRGSGHNVTRETLSSTLRLFIASNQIYCFSIGSGENDSIFIKELHANHAIMKIENSKLILEAKHSCEVYTQGTVSPGSRSKSGQLEKKAIEPGEKFSVNLESSFDWKMVFPDQTVFLGKIFRSKESLLPGTQGYLDLDYGIIDQIQESPVSLIYKTKSKKAVKVLRPSLVDSQQKVPLRFINAARKFQSFRTPLFLKIHEIVYRRDMNLCFITTPYFEGEPLNNILARKGTLSLFEAARIIEGVTLRLLALQNYHSCFRNLAPDNILVGENGEIALTGFFLAKSDVSMTGEMDQMIRAGYTAPEQIHSPSDVDISADVYSLGAIYFNMLVGEAPIQTDSNMEYTQILSSCKPMLAKDIHKIHPGIPDTTCELIASMLSLDKNYRPTPIKILQALSSGKSDEVGKLALKTRATEVNVTARNLPEEKDNKKSRKKIKLSESELRQLKRSLEDGERELTVENFAFIEKLNIISTQEQSDPNPKKELANVLKNTLLILFFLVGILAAILFVLQLYK